MYAFKYGLSFRQYLVVPEAENTIAHGFEAGRPFLIFFCTELMLTTISFDNQFGLDAGEVDDIGRRLYYELALEFMATHTMSP